MVSGFLESQFLVTGGSAPGHVGMHVPAIIFHNVSISLHCYHSPLSHTQCPEWLARKLVRVDLGAILPQNVFFATSSEDIRLAPGCILVSVVIVFQSR